MRTPTTQNQHKHNTSPAAITLATAAEPRTLLAQIIIIAAILAAGYVGIVQPARSELTNLRQEADTATQRASDAERIRPVADRYHASRVAAESWIHSASQLGSTAQELTILLAHLEELAIDAGLHVEQISPAVRQSGANTTSRRTMSSQTSTDASAQSAEQTHTAPTIDHNGCEIRVRGHWNAVLLFIRSISEQGLTAVDAVKITPVLGGDGHQIQARISTRHAWITEQQTTNTTSTPTTTESGS